MWLPGTSLAWPSTRIGGVVRTRANWALLVALLMIGSAACTAGASRGPSADPTAEDSPAAAGMPHPPTSPRPSPDVSRSSSASVASAAHPAPTMTPGAAAAPAVVPTTGEIWTTGPVSDWAGPIPSCGVAVTSSYPTGSTATPAPNVCVFTGESPGCLLPTMIVADGTTETLTTWLNPTPQTDSGPMLNGAGGYICVFENADRTVSMSDGTHGILIRPSATPIGYASRIGLVRSAGVWGIVSVGVATVRIGDAARPHGVLAELHPIGSDFQVFIAPVSSSPVSITALDKSGNRLAQTVLPECC